MRSARASSTWSPAASRSWRPRSASSTSCPVQSSGSAEWPRTRMRSSRALAATACSPMVSAVSIASSRNASAQANSPIDHHAPPQVGEERQPVAALGRQEAGRTAEEVRGRRHVAADERALARGGQAGCRAELRARVRGRRAARARRRFSVGLLEVVAEDLLVLGGPVAIRLTSSAQSTKRSCRVARDRFRRRLYAASRMRMCWKRKLAWPSGPGGSGRTSRFRMRPARPASTRLRRSSATTASTALAWKIWPTTAAASSTELSVGSRTSMRAARSASSEGGTEMLSRSPAGTQLPLSRRSLPSSMSMESICSTKSGFPSAASTILERASVAIPTEPSRLSTIRLASSSESASRWTRTELSSEAHSSTELPAASASRGRRRGSERPAPTRSGARSGRGTSPPPSGRPRRRGRPGACAPGQGPRRAVSPPTRARPPGTAHPRAPRRRRLGQRSRGRLLPPRRSSPARPRADPDRRSRRPGRPPLGVARR